MRLSRLARLAPILLLLLFTGCTYEKIEGNHFYSGFSWWVPLTMIAGAGIAAFVGYQIREKTNAAGYIIMLFSIIVGLGFAPSWALNWTVVDDTGFRMRGGLFGLTSHRADYDQTRSIKHTYQDSTTRRGGRIRKYYLDCVMTDGYKQSIELSSVGAEEGGRFFVEQAKTKNIFITDETIDTDKPLWMR